jgi:hypothetical protein
MKNFYLLDIVDGMDIIVRTIELDYNDLYLLQDLLYKKVDINETGGVTIRLKLKSKYVIL